MEPKSNGFVKALTAMCFSGIALGVFWLLGEGVYALSQKGSASTSLLYKAYRKLRPIQPALGEDTGILENYIHDRQSFARRLDQFKSSGVLLGNSPFQELSDPDIALTWIDPKSNTPKNKANVTLNAWFLRSRVFNPYDPVVFQKIENDRPLHSDVQAFLNRYGFQKIVHTTNERGERTTLPIVEDKPIMLMIGDSVAFGTMVQDHETLASVLQRSDQAHRYVNAGVPGNGVDHNLQILKEKLEEYQGQVAGVLYVHCENDIPKTMQASAFVAHLSENLSSLLDRHRVEQRIFLFTQYIYRTMPDLVRRQSNKLPKLLRLKAELMTDLESKGFQTVDWAEVVAEEQNRSGSLFAGFALYVDHCHLSRLGTELLAQKIKIDSGPNVKDSVK